METKHQFKSKIIIGILSVIILVLIAAMIFVIVKGVIPGFSIGQEEATLTSSNIMAKLQSSSDLITAKVIFRGIAMYSDEGIPVLSKGDFVMTYTAAVKAGIDISKVDLFVDNEERIVYIYTPDVEILDVKVNSNSIEIFNTSFALVNTNEKEDLTKALQMAEEDAQKDALDTGILDLAKQQSKILIEGLLSDTVSHDYTISFLESKELFDQKKVLVESKEKPTGETENLSSQNSSTDNTEAETANE